MIKSLGQDILDPAMIVECLKLIYLRENKNLVCNQFNRGK